jgi:hypothetical protein
LDGSPNCEKSDVVILLGLGFTNCRLAKRLLLRRVPVFAATRNPERFRSLQSLGVAIFDLSGTAFPREATIVYSIPPLPDPDSARIHLFVSRLRPRRVVYISSTSVYGAQTMVDETTPDDASDDKSGQRIAEEQWISSGPWSSLIIRPAAIYGPGRGVHVRVRDGQSPRGSLSGMVSRIHVDDLAAVIEAGVFSHLTGAWPVADERPCPSQEIANWCRRLLKIEIDPQGSPLVAGRTVDGTRLRELLMVRLAYPDYESGVLASLAEENYRADNATGVRILT